MYKGYMISVVMPVHNEVGHLRRAIANVPDFVDLLVVVDDGSTDQTWEQLSYLGGEGLIKLRHPVNLGVGAATKTGYLFCADRDIDYIAVMDGDAQMDGEDLPTLLDRAIAGADYVKGNRFHDRLTLHRMPTPRLVGNIALSWLTAKAAGFESKIDAQCGYTVIKRTALHRLDLDELYDRYGFLNEIFFAARDAGLRIDQGPVKSIYGQEQSGINPITVIPRILFLIARSYVRRIRHARSEKGAARVLEGEGNSLG